MPKYKHTTDKPIPVRVDPATGANIDLIIASGIAKDRSAAIRAGVAALARGLVADPRVWVVIGPGGCDEIFATEQSAIAWLQERGARLSEAMGWVVYDEDGDPEMYYDLEPIVPQ